MSDCLSLYEPSLPLRPSDNGLLFPECKLNRENKTHLVTVYHKPGTNSQRILLDIVPTLTPFKGWAIWTSSYLVLYHDFDTISIYCPPLNTS